MGVIGGTKNGGCNLRERESKAENTGSRKNVDSSFRRDLFVHLVRNDNFLVLIGLLGSITCSGVKKKYCTSFKQRSATRGLRDT